MSTIEHLDVDAGGLPAADSDKRIRVVIRKPSGEIALFSQRVSLRQAKADVAGLRRWGIDARLEVPPPMPTPPTESA